MNTTNVPFAPTLLASMTLLGVTAQPALAQTALPADDRVQCIDEAQKAQRLRSAGKLLEAGAVLASCLRTSCPEAVRRDCSLWQREVVRSTPSILVHATSSDGAEIGEVRLLIDEKRVVQSIGGQPISLDPGDHVVQFSYPGAVPVTESVRLEPGRKNQLMSVSFTRVRQAASSETSGGLRIPLPRSSAPNVLAWTATGLSLAAVGSFIYFGTTGKSQFDALKETCPSACDPSSIDSANAKLTIANVSLGVAFVSATFATILFLGRSEKDDKTPPTSGFGAKLAPKASGVTLHWQGQF